MSPDPVLVVVRYGVPDERIVGIHAIPGRMPELRRMPGETLTSLVLRARAALRGDEPVAASLILLPLQ